ncbi:hypothetical protein DE146DRAFT_381843 [Phaeosphaeria sp. MPI-PUGE-AT-0046c]|nr:hypothetical protein DE146DRAFT_381843 [Phaeosphaeria sp. MPI-PUGE-AT-0046c]
MSSSRVLVRHARSLPIASSCAFCQARLITSYMHGNALNNPSKRSSRETKSHVHGLHQAYATSAKPRLDTQRLRVDVDERARLGFYALNQKQKVLLIDRVTANSIAKEFLVNQKTMDPGKNVQNLTTRYNVSVEDLASLALITYKIPDLSNPDKKAALPPSRHKPLAIAMLQGCAQLEDPLAVTQILTAVYIAGTSNEAGTRELASHFPQAVVAKCQDALTRLGAKAAKIELGPDVLTLQGLFFERDGKTEQAEKAYTEAVQRCQFKFNPRSRHPMQIPLITPWNALGQLLKTSQDPSRREQAKGYFKRGASEGDDPLSCLELAAFEKRGSLDWLKYTSKVAASGHRDAMVDLAEFYSLASAPDSPVLADSATRKALGWLLGWKGNSTVRLAAEWLQAAANMGHKPSILKLADHYKSIGDMEVEKEYLRKLAAPPSQAAQVEEWPQLAQLGRQRLAGIR